MFIDIPVGGRQIHLLEASSAMTIDGHIAEQNGDWRGTRFHTAEAKVQCRKRWFTDSDSPKWIHEILLITPRLYRL